METRSHRRCAAFLLGLILLPAFLLAQGKPSDYEQANKLREKFQGLALGVPERAAWIGDTSRFWYRKSVKGGNDVRPRRRGDARQETGLRPREAGRRPLRRLGGKVHGRYPALRMAITFVDNERAIDFAAAGFACGDATFRTTPARKRVRLVTGSGNARRPEVRDEYPAEFGNDVFDGMVDLSPHPTPSPATRLSVSRAKLPAPRAPRRKGLPDGKWEAIIQNYNVFLRPKGKTEARLR